jgi:hypothetical protein
VAQASDVLGLSGLQTSVFSGQTVDATTVLVKYTQVGDADLDGTVGFADLARLAQNYNSSAGGTWARGDFNYDGRIDFADLAGLAQNYNRGKASMPAASATTLAPAMVSSTDPEVLLGRRRPSDRTFNHPAPVRKPAPVAKARRAVR